MAILKKFVPEPKIKDYRYSEGVYYEAKCDQCGRIYYPKRSTSKFCSKICTVQFANGGILANNPDNDLKPILQLIKERKIKPVP